MKILETKKLFYNEYAYKLGFYNPLAHIFREKKFKFALEELETLQKMYNNNEPLTLGSLRKKTYTVESFFECKWLYGELQSRDNYKIRIEYPIFQIYSNDKEWLQYIGNNIESPQYFYEPFVKLSRNIIIVSKASNYQYRITLNSKPDPSLAKWIIANPKLAKAGPVFLKEVANKGYSKGLYFYVRDDKVLGIVSLMLGSSSRIDKLVCKQDLDK